MDTIPLPRVAAASFCLATALLILPAQAQESRGIEATGALRAGGQASYSVTHPAAAVGSPFCVIANLAGSASSTRITVPGLLGEALIGAELPFVLVISSFASLGATTTAPVAIPDAVDLVGLVLEAQTLDFDLRSHQIRFSDTASHEPILPSEDEDSLRSGTSVGQVNGTPSGNRGSTVSVFAGLSRRPSQAWGYNQCISGRVRMFYASGSQWVFAGETTARNCHSSPASGPNTYGLAEFRFRIPSGARQRSHLRLRFEYPGDSWHFPSVGYGNVYVR
jgi:hypothetical protein